MNNNYEQYFDLNFEEAYNLCTTKYTHQDLNSFLRDGNVVQKQYAAMCYDRVENLSDAKTLLNNLTGCDGKIREAVAMKIYNFVKNDNNILKIFEKTDAEIFANATIDINANICRLVVETANLLKNDTDFAKKYTSRIMNFIEDTFCELDKFIFKDKKYVINKQLFKLYWCLETLQNFYVYVDKATLKQILEKASNVKEYTIREQAAKVILLSNLFPDLKIKLQNDENYYVKNVFN